MILRNKLVPVALGAALLGGSVGAFVMRPKTETTAETPRVASAAATVPAQNVVPAAAAETQTPAADSAENAAFREGFAEGVRAAREEGLVGAGAPAAERTAVAAAPQQRVVYRNASRGRTVRSRAASRQVYYDYNRPRSRSFWQKHRDKLTVAMGAGGGALVGGLIGGKKGALIGGLAGAGGSALYTYKLRKRDRRY